jgi:hypothetical protein
MVQRGDNLIAHRYDEIFSNDKINFLTFCLAIVCAMGREVEHQERHVPINGDQRRGGGVEKLPLNLFTDREFVGNLPNIFFIWLFEVDPHATSILVSKYHASRIPCDAASYCRVHARAK